MYLRIAIHDIVKLSKSEYAEFEGLNDIELAIKMLNKYKWVNADIRVHCEDADNDNEE